MGESDENTSLFSQVVGDMKVMGPLWDDLLMKTSKFYSAVKQAAMTADVFLDSFQKIADATTNSKGATRDIGVSFTKIVMRHRAVENKLKTFVGILADNFITPLQDTLDDWKKNANQLEKDHAKDYKRLKGELKKALTETTKLKKKASKKIGRQEYTEQFREAVKLSNHLGKVLEDQEKSYLRKLMIEERARATQFFHYYKPCMEQQITLLADIEQLQSILDETSLQCESPYLPAIYEDVINEYKIPEYLSLNDRRGSSNDESPPMSAYEKEVRYGSVNCTPTHGRIPLRRSMTAPSCSRNGMDPIPVSLPTPPMCHEIVSSSFSSSSSSVDQIPQNYDSVNAQDFELAHSPPHFTSSSENESYMTSQMNSQGPHKSLKAHTSWSSIGTSDSSGIGSYNSLISHNRSSNLSGSHLQNYNGNESDPIEADIGSDYQNIDMFTNFGGPPGFHHPVSTSEQHAKYATIDRSHFRRNKSQTWNNGDVSKQRSNSVEGSNGEQISTIHDFKMNLQNGQSQKVEQSTDDLGLHMKQFNAKREQKYGVDPKYATVDRSHIRRNQMQIAQSLKEIELKQRANSIDGENGENFPSFPDYKMNLPKSKVNSLGRHNMYTSAKKPTIFQIFDGQNIGQNVSEVLKRLSPTSSPSKQTFTTQTSTQINSPSFPQKSPTISSPQIRPQIPHQNDLMGVNSLNRRNSSPPVRPLTMPKPKNVIAQKKISLQTPSYEPKAFTECNDPEPAKPGSFEAALQERRNSLLKKCT